MSLLGTGKEMQKLKYGIGPRASCGWGGFPAFTSHQEHVSRRRSLSFRNHASGESPKKDGVSSRHMLGAQSTITLPAREVTLGNMGSSHASMGQQDRRAPCSDEGHRCRLSTVIRWVGSPGTAQILGGFARITSPARGARRTLEDGQVHRRVRRQRHRSSRHEVQAVPPGSWWKKDTGPSAGEGGQVSCC